MDPENEEPAKKRMAVVTIHKNIAYSLQRKHSICNGKAVRGLHYSL